MPSVTDTQQQQTTTTTQQITAADADPLTQMILVLEKKQRNLGKRKEKLEIYQKQEKEGKELNKDQKDALAKCSDVLGQIDCLKEVNEQFKKIQTEITKNQKRLSKQAFEEKRQSFSQILRQYAQIRYLLEHRPIDATTQSEESTVLDQLSAAIIPSDYSADSISRSVDTVLSIYQHAPPAIVKNLTKKNPQEVREILEQFIQKFDSPPPQQQQQPEREEEEQQVIEIPTPPTTTTATIEEEPPKEIEQPNNVPLVNRTLNEYPLQFDTRNQTLRLEEIMQDQTFFPVDLNHQINDENREQSPDPNQYIPTMTVVNSSINDQSSTSLENQQQQQHEQEHGEGHARPNRGRGYPNRGGQQHYGNRNPNRRGSNQYYQNYRNQQGGYYDNSYNTGGGGQRPYYDNPRGRGGYRGNRGGNYRYNSNGNGYQNSAQHQNVRSAPPASSSEQAN